MAAVPEGSERVRTGRDGARSSSISRSSMAYGRRISSRAHDLIAHEVEPYDIRRCRIEEMRPHGLPGVRPQLLPGVPLGDDVLGEALRRLAAVWLLAHLEHQLGHLRLVTPPGCHLVPPAHIVAEGLGWRKTLRGPARPGNVKPSW